MKDVEGAVECGGQQEPAQTTKEADKDAVHTRLLKSLWVFAATIRILRHPKEIIQKNIASKGTHSPKIPAHS